jgi:hypothetical protein
LVFAAAGPAALGLSGRSAPGSAETEAVSGSLSRPVMFAGSLGAAAGLVVALLVLPQRDAAGLGASPALVAEIATRTDGRVVLAPEPLIESLVAVGVTAWASNPIDAFDHDVQNAYLDFIDDGEVEPAFGLAKGTITAIVVTKDSPAAKAVERRGGFARQSLGDGWLLYLAPVV